MPSRAVTPPMMILRIPSILMWSRTFTAYAKIIGPVPPGPD
jgi:hypothetical protein